MNKLKSIVVGVDLSKCSRCALQQAARMAQWNHARLQVIHAVEHLVISDLADALGQTPAQIETATMHETKQRLREWLPETLQPEELNFDVEVGPPIDVLLRKVRAVAADLLVLGLHGEDARLPRGAGTLATKCMRKAPAKVLLVQEQQLQPFRTVLACVDFSETSREAVAQALRVGVQDQSQIHFLHVFQGPWHRLHYRAATTEASPTFQQHYRLLLEHRLKEFVGDTAGLDTRFKVFDASSRGCGITEYAQQVRADLVVLGTKGRTNLGYVLLGSTVERLLRELPCSALTVRAAKENPGSTPLSAIPTGLCLPAQGCSPREIRVRPQPPQSAATISRGEERATLGGGRVDFQPQRGCATIPPPRRNPVGVVAYDPRSQPRKLSGLGFKPESRWDSSLEFLKGIRI